MPKLTKKEKGIIFEALNSLALEVNQGTFGDENLSRKESETLLAQIIRLESKLMKLLK